MKIKPNTATALAVACIALLCVLLVGCKGATGMEAMQSGDPTERGFGYIAAAIVTGAIIRALFSK